MKQYLLYLLNPIWFFVQNGMFFQYPYYHVMHKCIAYGINIHEYA
jgi:hypothetical protein